MDSSAEPDIPVDDPGPAGPSALDAPGAEPAATRWVRRLGFDPASSPVLVAAFAWDSPDGRG